MRDASTSADPIHGYFGLSYAAYLVLPRSVLQSMSGDWQSRFVACLGELDAAWEGSPGVAGYDVRARDDSGRYVVDPCVDYGRGRRRLELREDEGLSDDRIDVLREAEGVLLGAGRADAARSLVEGFGLIAKEDIPPFPIYES